MRPLVTIAESTSPDGTAISLHQRGDEWLIRAGGQDLMSSRAHGSEQEMARFIPANASRVLVGGLGMGFTLRAALDACPGEVTVAELIPAVIAWNEGPLAPLAGAPLADPRARIHHGDVADALRSPAAWDAVLLDVDNGPDAFTQASNSRLYTPDGLKRTRMALKPGGVLVVWSAYPSPDFLGRLRRAGLRGEAHTVRAHAGRGARHTLYVAQV
jgi:spermidine synthase